MTKVKLSYKRKILIIAFLIILLLAITYAIIGLIVSRMSSRSSTVYGRPDQISYENLPESFEPIVLTRELPNGNYCLSGNAEKCYFEIKNNRIRFVSGEYSIDDLIHLKFGDDFVGFSEFNELCESAHEIKIVQFYKSSDHNYIIWDWNEDSLGHITSCKGFLLNDDGSISFMDNKFVLS